MSDFVISGERVFIDRNSRPEPASLLIQSGKIVKIKKGALSFSATRIVDAGNLLVLPGFVDTHAHINEPGRTDWEGFRSATRAAAAGGITTVIDMPLNSIPATTSLAALRVKRASAHTQCAIDYGFWGGVIPGNAAELEPMIKAGVMGFKCFLCPSGVDEFPNVTAQDLKIAMPILAKAQVPLIVHAELESDLHLANNLAQNSYETYLLSRPPEWECAAVELMIKLSKSTGCAVHIVHLSAAAAIPMIRKARAEGVPLTVETCPHYLHLDAEHILKGATQFKCAPPIRSKSNQEQLWAALREGVIDFIVSDHSPCVPSLKLMETGNFMKAWGGVSGLQMSTQIVWTEMLKRGLEVGALRDWMSYQTAKFVGLGHRKGSLSEGYDADVVFFDEQAETQVLPSTIHHKHKVTPYAGEFLKGRVSKTFVRGNLVYNDGVFEEKVYGCELLRNY